MKIKISGWRVKLTGEGIIDFFVEHEEGEIQKASLSDLAKYLEAYDPEIANKESVWNQAWDGLGLVYMDGHGDLSISDEFAEAIKAKITEGGNF